MSFCKVCIYTHLVNSSIPIWQKKTKMSLWNTKPLIMANSNKGQDQKDKYFDSSRKILSQEMTMCNMEALVCYFSEVTSNVNFLKKKLVKCQGQKVEY